MKDIYIVIYNAETDFCKCYTPKDVERVVGDLIEEGCAQNDIEVYRGRELKVGFNLSQIEITIIEEAK